MCVCAREKYYYIERGGLPVCSIPHAHKIHELQLLKEIANCTIETSNKKKKTRKRSKQKKNQVKQKQPEEKTTSKIGINRAELRLRKKKINKLSNKRVK